MVGSAFIGWTPCPFILSKVRFNRMNLKDTLVRGWRLMMVFEKIELHRPAGQARGGDELLTARRTNGFTHFTLSGNGLVNR